MGDNESWTHQCVSKRSERGQNSEISSNHDRLNEGNERGFYGDWRFSSFGDSAGLVLLVNEGISVNYGLWPIQEMRIHLLYFVWGELGVLKFYKLGTWPWGIASESDGAKFVASKDSRIGMSTMTNEPFCLPWLKRGREGCLHERYLLHTG